MACVDSSDLLADDRCAGNLYSRCCHGTRASTRVVAGTKQGCCRSRYGLFKMDNNWFRKSESGLYELYVEGEPFERGAANGKLTRELVEHQEEVFTEQIHRLVPSDFYLEILKYFVGWFNRDLQANVIEEYQLEILGVSYSASREV